LPSRPVRFQSPKRGSSIINHSLSRHTLAPVVELFNKSFDPQPRTLHSQRAKTFHTSLPFRHPIAPTAADRSNHTAFYQVCTVRQIQFGLVPRSSSLCAGRYKGADFHAQAAVLTSSRAYRKSNSQA